MLIAPKRLKIQTSNLASMLPSKSWHHDTTTEKNFGKGTWQGTHDRDNSTVQTAAMGQIPRSTNVFLLDPKVAVREKKAHHLW